MISGAEMRRDETNPSEYRKKSGVCGYFDCRPSINDVVTGEEMRKWVNCPKVSGEVSRSSAGA